jgi:hypothetical protein
MGLNNRMRGNDFPYALELRVGQFITTVVDLPASSNEVVIPDGLVVQTFAACLKRFAALRCVVGY